MGAWDPERLDRQIFVGDAREYHRIAGHLLEDRVFSGSRRPPLEPETGRVPLYPAFLALCYGIFGPHPHRAILLQLVFGALTCGVTVRIGALLFDRRAAILAGLLLAVDYSSVIFSNRLYSDTLFTFLFALVLWALARFVVSGSTRDLAVAGALLGAATLCRPVSVYFGLALAPLVWLRLRRRPVLALARWGALVAAFALVVAPWVLRNYRLTGRPYVSSMQAQIVEWLLPAIVGPARGEDAAATATPADAAGGVAPSVAVPATPATPPPLTWRDAAVDAGRYVSGAARFFAILGSGELPLILGIPYGRHDAIALRTESLRGWVEATLRNRSSPFERTVVVAFLAWLVVLYTGAALGIARAIRDRRWTETTLLVLSIAYFVVATGVIAWEVRYRLPTLPAIVLLAGYGFAQVSRRSPASNSRSAARRRAANATPERSAVSSSVFLPSL